MFSGNWGGVLIREHLILTNWIYPLTFRGFLADVLQPEDIQLLATPFHAGTSNLRRDSIPGLWAPYARSQVQNRVQEADSREHSIRLLFVGRVGSGMGEWRTAGYTPPPPRECWRLTLYGIISCDSMPASDWSQRMSFLTENYLFSVFYDFNRRK